MVTETVPTSTELEPIAIFGKAERKQLSDWEHKARVLLTVVIATKADRVQARAAAINILTDIYTSGYWRFSVGRQGRNKGKTFTSFRDYSAEALGLTGGRVSQLLRAEAEDRLSHKATPLPDGMYVARITVRGERGVRTLPLGVTCEGILARGSAFVNDTGDRLRAAEETDDSVMAAHKVFVTAWNAYAVALTPFAKQATTERDSLVKAKAAAAADKAAAAAAAKTAKTQAKAAAAAAKKANKHVAAAAAAN